MNTNKGKKRQPCPIEGCTLFHYGKGLCQKHYRLSPRFQEENKAKRNSPEYKEIFRGYCAEYRNRDYVKKRKTEFLKLPKQRYRILCSRAKRKGLVVELTLQQHIELTTTPCIYCDSFSEGENYVGVDRIDSNVGYTIDNSVPCCSMCNYMKTDFPVDAWLKQIMKIAALQQKK